MDRKQALAILAAGLSGCSKSSGLTVGAKNFTEQDILGEILAQHLSTKLGLEVKRRLHLGGSYLAHTALVNGDIDLYPEYSGTALTACLKLPLERDPERVFESVRDAYLKRHDVEWGWPLGFENTFAMVIPKRLGFRTLSEAVQRKQDWRLGIGYEFEARPDGWPLFQKTYPLKLGERLKTMDLGLLYRALNAGEVDMAAGNTTDAALATGAFTVLEDDLHFFPPYQTCLAVRRAALQAHAGLRAALDQLTGKISAESMRRMNADVTQKKQEPSVVARDFLRNWKV
jgi:osmoprotectant transport system substrate-binding protein